MTMADYFKQFPLTVYANTVAVDMTRRAGLARSLIADRRAYLPYEIPAGMRADQVAQHYYGDHSYAWAVYISAQMVDPYAWYKPTQEFNAHIVEKYGSVESAILRTHHYQLNWAGDESTLSPEGWAAIDPPLKKYWEAVYGEGSRIIYYSRREEDWTAATNMTVNVTIDPGTSNAPAVGEVVTVYDPTQTFQGTCEVAWSNGTVLVVKHVETGLTPGYTMTTNTGASSLITQSYSVSNTIPIDERPYWTRYSFLDYETEKNEALKSIKLVDSKYAQQMDLSLKKVLNK
jgi:hypothetical protein